ncbi:hypothetical protein HDU98_012269 [Podochytrium sp. JEL0797]|nr:hypothetical protein HDU98_012269 [Podochytrium sp. JEL0797]
MEPSPFDTSRFEFLTPLTAALHRLVGDPSSTSWSLDSLKADSAEMAAFRKAIQDAKALVIAAQEYHDSLPGIELSKEDQERCMRELDEELAAKERQIETYRNLPVFQRARRAE